VGQCGILALHESAPNHTASSFRGNTMPVCHTANPIQIKCMHDCPKIDVPKSLVGQHMSVPADRRAYLEGRRCDGKFEAIGGEGKMAKVHTNTSFFPTSSHENRFWIRRIL